MSDLPPELTGYVKGTFTEAIAAASDGDGDVTGRAILIPDPDWVRVLEGTPMTVLPTPLILTLDPATGKLEDPEGNDVIGVLGTDAQGTDPTGFTWRVRYEFDYGQTSLEMDDFHISIPVGEPEAAVDLTLATPSAASDGSAVAAGFSDQAAAQLVNTPGSALRDAISLLAADQGSGGATDAAVAALVTSTLSETHQALHVVITAKATDVVEDLTATDISLPILYAALRSQ